MSSRHALEEQGRVQDLGVNVGLGHDLAAGLQVIHLPHGIRQIQIAGFAREQLPIDEPVFLAAGAIKGGRSVVPFVRLKIVPGAIGFDHMGIGINDHVAARRSR